MKKGFTLIELLVVISIISLLSSIVLASLNTAREKGRIGANIQFDTTLKHSLGDSLVAEWTFDSPSSPWIDTSGWNHDGAPSGGISVLSTGGFNGKGAASFDGVDDSVSIGPSSSYFPLPTFTVCGWIKSSGLAPGVSQPTFLSITYGFVFYLDSSGNFVSKITNGTSNVNISAAGALHDNRFHHLCVTADASTRWMYIDGVLKTTQSVPWPGLYPGGGFVGLGYDANNYPPTKFSGILDDLRIYSRVLTSSNISQIYASEKAKFELAGI